MGRYEELAEAMSPTQLAVFEAAFEVLVSGERFDGAEDLAAAVAERAFPSD